MCVHGFPHNHEYRLDKAAAENTNVAIIDEHNEKGIENSDEFRRLKRSTEKIKTTEQDENDIDDKDESSGEVEDKSADTKYEYEFKKIVKSTESKTDKESSLEASEKENENKGSSLEAMEIENSVEEMKSTENGQDKELTLEQVEGTEVDNDGKETPLEGSDKENLNNQPPEIFRRDKKSKGFWDKAADALVITNFVADAIVGKMDKGFY